MCSEYRSTFFGSKEQILTSDLYNSPNITIEIQGPFVFTRLSNVPWFLPAKVAYRMRSSAMEYDISPPKASSTYEPRTAFVLYWSLKFIIQDLNHKEAQRQKILEELAFPKGIARSI